MSKVVTKLSQKHSPSTKNMCKELFFRGLSDKEIHEATNIPLITVTRWVEQEKWAEEYLTVIKASEVYFRVKKAEAVDRTFEKGLEIINKGLIKLNAKFDDEDFELRPKEMKAISDIAESLYKMGRLEKDMPTEIIKKCGLTPEEARDILKNDPFASGVVEAEFEVMD